MIERRKKYFIKREDKREKIVCRFNIKQEEKKEGKHKRIKKKGENVQVEIGCRRRKERAWHIIVQEGEGGGGKMRRLRKRNNE